MFHGDVLITSFPDNKTFHSTRGQTLMYNSISIGSIYVSEKAGCNKVQLVLFDALETYKMCCLVVVCDFEYP